MRTELTTVTLKTGEPMRIECVLAPDAECQEQIRPFLNHKPNNYLYHLDSAFADQCDALETRFYIGLIGDEMVGNIMTSEYRGVGVFGHVHTREDQRRKGICSHIMQYQMEEFREREGKVLLLGTGYQSAAYNIYASYGFRDWDNEQTGRMRYDNPAFPNFEAEFFAPTKAQVVPAQWRHWSLVCLLAHLPGNAHLRSVLLEVWGIQLLEGGYCHYLYAFSRNSNASAVVLESETGAVTAMATRVPDKRWNNAVLLLDLFAHPNFGRDAYAALLEALPPADRPTHCYADPQDAEKGAALEGAGFARVALLPSLIVEGDARRDAWLYQK